MQGRRIQGEGVSAHAVEPGDYFKDDAGDWRGKTPNGLAVWLKNHAITEHEDGTITAHPSIAASNGTGNKKWHGFLERGVWREC